jgi:hypothetical protein
VGGWVGSGLKGVMPWTIYGLGIHLYSISKLDIMMTLLIHLVTHSFIHLFILRGELRLPYVFVELVLNTTQVPMGLNILTPPPRNLGKEVGESRTISRFGRLFILISIFALRPFAIATGPLLRMPCFPDGRPR